MKKIKIDLKDPKQAARNADLVYVNDDIPGFKRQKAGNGWKYLDQQNQVITAKAILSRIQKLGIPPAYNDVWICPLKDGHLQFTGRDAKGRKQYRYHTKWREYRSQINHTRMIAFGQMLPKIRTQIEKDLNQSELNKTKVLATIVKLMDLTTIRVGNDEYAKENQSYGLTTLREKHVTVAQGKIRFEFKGKSHQKHFIELKNKKLAKIVQRCIEVPGYELFQYYDTDRQRHKIDSSAVNEYLQQISGQEFTAKDFRTWWGTVFAMVALQNCPIPQKKSEIKKNVTQTIKEVSKKLGNTPTVCKKYYIYPGLIDSYLAGKLTTTIQNMDNDNDSTNLNSQEKCALNFLQTHLAT